MRILVVADVHANPAALAAITEPFDACLCLGDLVEYGPDPRAVLDWCRGHVTACVRGNHDHGSAQNVDVQGVSGFRYLTMATRPYTRNKLTECDRRFLAELPTTRYVTVGGFRFLLVHASPRDPLDEYMPPDPEVWASRLKGVSADFVCVGHTHQQYTLKVGETTVLNPGSLGLPRDGDPRARYAVIEDGAVKLRQVGYDIEATVRAVEKTDLPRQAKSMLADVYREGRYIHPAGLPLPANGFQIRPVVAKSA
jgi:putative phosphoesterase